MSETAEMTQKNAHPCSVLCKNVRFWKKVYCTALSAKPRNR